MMMADNSLELTERSSSSSSTLSQRPRTILARMFSNVYIGNLKFVIMDCPTDNNIDEYLKELLNRGVTDVVRVCNPTYDKQTFESSGITVHDWAFPDGTTPPPDRLDKMLSLCHARFGSLSLSQQAILDKSFHEDKGPAIAIHCVAGLGRAPVMVCVALIEAGLEPMDAVSFVRKCRRGALNSIQLQFLVDNYRRKTKKPGFFSVLPGKRNTSPKRPKGDIVESLSKVFRFIKPPPGSAQPSLAT